MELANISKNKVKVLCVAVALVAISMIGVAYAYATHVIGNGDITGNYYAVDIYEGASDADPIPSTTKLNSLIMNSGGEYQPYSYTSGQKYYVHIESNAIKTAWLYGSFELSSDSKKGILIESISITLVNGDKEIATTLYRNAYKDSIHTGETADSSLISGEVPVNANWQITHIAVTFIDIADDPMTIEGDQVTQAEAKSVSNLSFVFWASSAALLTSS